MIVFTAKYYIVYMDHIIIIHLSVEEYLSGSHFLAIVNRVEMNMDDQVSMERDVKTFEHTSECCSWIIWQTKLFCYSPPDF